MFLRAASGRTNRTSCPWLDLPIANHEDIQERKLIVGNYVALCDSDSADPEDDHFHLCKVIETDDNTAVLLNYATFSTNLATAKFSIMYASGKAKFVVQY